MRYIRYNMCFRVGNVFQRKKNVNIICICKNMKKEEEGEEN